MKRTVEDVALHEIVEARGPDGEPVTRYAVVGRGVTHYRGPFADHVVGERLRMELLQAGLPDTTLVTLAGPDLDVALRGDDQGEWEATVATVVKAHKGTRAADHRALVDFAAAVADAARRLAHGEAVTTAERDLLLGIALTR